LGLAPKRKIIGRKKEGKMTKRSRRLSENPPDYFNQSVKKKTSSEWWAKRLTEGKKKRGGHAE